MARILLVTMPFGSCNAPALGISLLRQELRHKGYDCEVRYLNMAYAARIGVQLYGFLANSFPTILLGEWIFAQALFGDQLPDAKTYVGEILQEYVSQHGREIPRRVLDRLDDLRRVADEYLDECLEHTPWETYDVIGFTSTFEQNLSALALAQRIKRRWPGKVIVFGGANWEGEMGLELMRQFPWVDFACSGEADWLFPELVASLASGRSIPRLPGLFQRVGDEVVAVGNHAPGILDMDALPLVEYHDYFEQLAEYGLEIPSDHISLLIETSRGCWWGAHSHCTFCGLNGTTMSYRSKSPERVLEEFRSLRKEYPQAPNVFVVDNILDTDYFASVLPALARQNLGLSLTYEVKANLRKEQVRMLKAAGINHIQPGIESLDSELLRLMAKGCTSSQNIQLLKWARQYDVDVSWNLLAGFPGADAAPYERMAALIPALAHLQPPTSRGVSWLRLDRFSPYFERPQDYGITNIRPVPAYRYVYPFSEESLNRLAYYFDYDDASAMISRPAVEHLHQVVDDWHTQQEANDSHPAPVLNSVHSSGSLVIYDTRPGARQAEYHLQGLEQVIYEFCEEARSLAAIQRYLRSQPAWEKASDDEILQTLESMTSRGLMLGPESPGFSDQRYLSLAVQIDQQAEELAAALFARLFASASDG